MASFRVVRESEVELIALLTEKRDSAKRLASEVDGFTGVGI